MKHLGLPLSNFLEQFKNNPDTFEVTLMVPKLDLLSELALLLIEEYPSGSCIFSHHSKINFGVGAIQNSRFNLQTKRYLSHESLKILHVTRKEILLLLGFFKKLVYLGAPHRDRFIFLGEDQILREFFTADIISSLKYKFGITVTGTLYKDPAIYNAGQMETSSGYPLFERNMNNLPGRSLKISAYPNPPFFYVDKERNFGGAYYNMLFHVGVKHNFTLNIDYRTPKGSGFYKNGIWNGMTGDVYYRRANVGMFMGLTVERFEIMDMVYVQPAIVRFMTRQPERRVNSMAVFYPFKPLTWLTILLGHIGSSIMLYVILSVKKYRNSLDQAICIPYQSTLSQGFDDRLPIEGRFLVAIFLLYMIVISTGYQSDLVSWLALPTLENIPGDFPTLDKRPDYKVIFNYHSGTSYHYFNNARSGFIKNIRQRFILEPDIQKCVAKAALEKRTICISWGPVITRAVLSNLTLPGPFQPMVSFCEPAVSFPEGYAFQRNSIFRDSFELLAKFWRDSGLIPRWDSEVYGRFRSKGKMWLKSQKSSELYSKLVDQWRIYLGTVRPFTFANVISAFAVLMGGIILAASLFAGEIYLKMSLF
ncbi:unnamed protein product [Allacma fusca]|uniref:Ionotropic receptor n=1 Tax=Allacma fusca TaxID=39272 RepID=A0A8J2L9Y5_9HEXA|nr:unnamed protein product [Allacma fusca]